MKNKLIIISLFCSLKVLAWEWWPLPMAKPDNEKDTLEYRVSLSAMVGKGQYTAYLMQSCEQGLVSASPNAGSIRASVYKRSTHPARWFDYDFAIDIVGNAHSVLPFNYGLLSNGSYPVWQARNGSIILHQAYAHARLYIVDIAAGVMPLTDGMNTPLGSGSLLLSDNVPSMPLIRIGFDNWTAFPGLYGYLEIKGGLVYGWMTDNIAVKKTKLHYKFAGVQIGGKLPVNISYEIHHTAQWGGYAADGTDLGNSFRDFVNIFFARAGGISYNEQYNAQGNHLGSQQLAITAKGNQWQVKAYWQNILEDNFAFIGNGQNLPDGRFGISAQQSKWQYINCLTLEYICTTDQSGPMHDQDGIIYAGNDNYYVNSIYIQGWNYYLRSLGNPLITSPLYNADGYLQTRNSRINAWHIGVGGDIYGFNYKVIATHARNYGCYNQGDWYAQRSQNTALMLEVNKRVKQAWNLEFGVRLATDIGSQFGNQFGAMITITKQGLIKQY